jgi:hypothetical protein
MIQHLLSVTAVFILTISVCSASDYSLGKPLPGNNDFAWGSLRKNIDKWNLSKNVVTISQDKGKDGLPALYFNIGVYKEGLDAKAVSPKSSGLEAGSWYEFSYFVKIKHMDYSARLLFQIDLGGGKIVSSNSNTQLQPADGGKKWIFINKQFLLPSGCSSAQVKFFLINGASELWISDLRLVKLPGKRKRINLDIAPPRQLCTTGESRI